MNQYNLMESLYHAYSRLPMPIYWVDLNCKILGANKPALQLINCNSLHEIINEPEDKVYPDELIMPIAARKIKNIATNPEIVKHNTQSKHPETGQLHYYTITRAPIVDDNGEMIALMNIFTDNTKEYRADKQLQHEEIFQNLEKITNLIPALVYWVDLEGIVIGVNNETCKRLGGLEIREKIVGKSGYDFYPKEVADTLSENRKKVIKLGKSIEFEEKVVDIATGETKYFTSIRSPLRDDEGEMIGIIGASVDITAEKQLQQQRAQEAANKARSEFIDNFPTPVYWKDRDSVFWGCNDPFVSVAGLKSRKEVMGKTDYDLPWKASAESFRQDDAEVIRTGRPKLNIEDVAYTASGETEFVISNKVPLRDDQGNVIGVLGMGTVVTKLKKAAEKAQALSAELDAMISYAPDIIYWKDCNSVHLGCNDKFALLAGLKSREEVVGKTDYDLSWKAYAASYQKDDAEVVRTGRPKLNIEDTIYTSLGTTEIVITNKVPLRDLKGNVIGVLAISTVITPLKKMEEKLRQSLLKAEADSKAKSEFIANMGHDIRAPLTEIVGFAKIIKKETKDLRVKEYADNLIAASHVPLKLFNGILGAIKVLTGDIPTVKRKFQLVDITEKIIQLVKPKALEKKLNIELNFDEKIPQYVVGDPTRIQCILLELISNALNFTEKGDITVDIKLARKQARELVVKCAVKDTGIGIPVDKQEDIFLRFKRLMPSYQGIYAGAGLGLTVVKQFIDDLKGEIYCQSEEGVGSNFICLIPMLEALLDDDTGVTEIGIMEAAIN